MNGPPKGDDRQEDLDAVVDRATGGLIRLQRQKRRRRMAKRAAVLVFVLLCLAGVGYGVSRCFGEAIWERWGERLWEFVQRLLPP